MSHENYTRHNVWQEGGSGESTGGGVERKRGAGPWLTTRPAAAPDLPLLGSPYGVRRSKGWILCRRAGAAEAPCPWCTAFWYGYIVKRSQLRAHNGARLPPCEEIIVIMDLWSTALAERIYCVELTSLGTPTSGTNCWAFVYRPLSSFEAAWSSTAGCCCCCCSPFHLTSASTGKRLIFPRQKKVYQHKTRKHARKNCP